LTLRQVFISLSLEKMELIYHLTFLYSINNDICIDSIEKSESELRKVHFDIRLCMATGLRMKAKLHLVCGGNQSD